MEKPLPQKNVKYVSKTHPTFSGDTDFVGWFGYPSHQREAESLEWKVSLGGTGRITFVVRGLGLCV